jgi:hypothetical protein
MKIQHLDLETTGKQGTNKICALKPKKTGRKKKTWKQTKGWQFSPPSSDEEEVGVKHPIPTRTIIRKRNQKHRNYIHNLRWIHNQ